MDEQDNFCAFCQGCEYQLGKIEKESTSMQCSRPCCKIG